MAERCHTTLLPILEQRRRFEPWCKVCAFRQVWNKRPRIALWRSILSPEFPEITEWSSKSVQQACVTRRTNGNRWGKLAFEDDDKEIKKIHETTFLNQNFCISGAWKVATCIWKSTRENISSGCYVHLLEKALNQGSSFIFFVSWNCKLLGLLKSSSILVWGNLSVRSSTFFWKNKHSRRLNRCLDDWFCKNSDSLSGS